ncbi:AAA family ATPase [Saccharopolyspora indica]|uniref:phosphatase domain-containing protein n=1 Tax=Saccharopolyspora indica TaxID=1229659 RepID=UPI0022EB33FE|nr:AAA family ATPase [Saccharopolyspora indica]MDA3643829.1 AAA family ATPase [Saccharopolyspora indica]
MKELFVYRGLPGSGKTTRARELQAATGACLVGRDHLRKLLFGKFVGLTQAQENEVTKVQERLIRDALRSDQPAIVDDMNLRARYVRRFMEIAEQEGAQISVIDLTNVELAWCEFNDRSRERSVGWEVIEDLHRRFIEGREYPLPLPELPEKPSELLTYKPPEGGQPAIIVDIDGTVAKMDGRSPYDYSRVSEDLPNEPVIGIVLMYHAMGYEILFTSGRPETCRADTVLWIKEHLGFGWGADYELMMRNAGDHRKDNVVKKELFDRFIRNHYRVAIVLDDRDQVVEMWRSLGLTCLQVAPGNF